MTRLVLPSLIFVLATAASASAQGQQPAPPPAPAQPAATTSASPTFEVGIGYQVLRAGEVCATDDDDNCASSHTFPLGFAIDGVRNFGHVGVVGEVGWSRDSDDIDGIDDASISENIFHYAGGLRWTAHNTGRAWPYGQILIGGATVHSSLDLNGSSDDTDTSDTRTRFILQPGVGVTVVGGDGWGVFGQVDYRRLFLKEDDDGSSGRNDFRVAVGVRFILD
jgi:hypothetical protein